jgi:hypothetical protein
MTESEKKLPAAAREAVWPQDRLRNLVDGLDNVRIALHRAAAGNELTPMEATTLSCRRLISCANSKQSSARRRSREPPRRGA